MKQIFHLVLAVVCSVLLLSGCGSSEPLALPIEIQPDATALRYTAAPRTWSTLEDLVHAADCVVTAEVLSSEVYSHTGTWRYQMRVLQDLSGNLNNTGCGTGEFYLYAMDDGYQPQHRYLLPLTGETIIGMPHIQYTELTYGLRIDLTGNNSSVQWRGLSYDWAAPDTVMQHTLSAVKTTAFEPLVYGDTIASFEEALETADEIWWIEVSNFVRENNEYFHTYDYQILEVLTGTLDISTPAARQYREPLPVKCQPTIGQRYLLLQTRTPNGTVLVSGAYCLLPADHPLYQQTLTDYQVDMGHFDTARNLSAASPTG